MLGASLPSASIVLVTGVVGLICIGLSLVMFMLGLRHLGTARTGAYFSLAPFIGAVVAIAMLGEPITVQLVVAGLLVGIGF